MDQSSSTPGSASVAVEYLDAISKLINEYPPHWTAYLVLVYEIVTQGINQLQFSILLEEILPYFPQIAPLHNGFADMVNSRCAEVFLSPGYVAMPSMDEIPGLVPASVRFLAEQLFELYVTRIAGLEHVPEEPLIPADCFIRVLNAFSEGLEQVHGPPMDAVSAEMNEITADLSNVQLSVTQAGEAHSASVRSESLNVSVNHLADSVSAIHLAATNVHDRTDTGYRNMPTGASLSDKMESIVRAARSEAASYLHWRHVTARNAGGHSGIYWETFVQWMANKGLYKPLEESLNALGSFH